MKKYFQHIGSDFAASLVLLLIALPLSIGIAEGSGAPQFAGIVAAIVGGIVVGILSGATFSVTGPTAGLSIIVASSIAHISVYEAFLLSVVIAGILQFILGYAKAGIIGHYIPSAVINGMLTAIGIILILKQIPHFVGYDTDFEGDESFLQSDKENTFTEMIQALQFITPAALLLGAITLAVLIFWESSWIKKHKLVASVPAPLVAILVSVLVHEYVKFTGGTYVLEAKHLIALPAINNFTELNSLLRYPNWSYLNNAAVWTSAISLAVVASLESLIAVEAIDKLDPNKHITPTDKELKAQGIGNIITGLLGGIPIASVVVRGSANIMFGARTKLANILHGFLVLVSVLLFSNLLNKIPLASLAAVLIFIGYKLVQFQQAKLFYRKGVDQFIPFIITVLAILLSDLLTGIIIGLCVGLFFMLRSNFRSAVFVINDNNNYLVRLRKDVSFLNKPIVKLKLEAIPMHADVLIDVSRADFIDQDIIEEINNFMVLAATRNIHVVVKKSLTNAMHQAFHEPQNKKL